jgi:type II secretion system protein D
MKEPIAHSRTGAWMLCLLLLIGVAQRTIAAEESAAQTAVPASIKGTTATAATNAGPVAAAVGAAAVATNGVPTTAGAATAATTEPPGAAPGPAGASDEIQLSLQGANVDMVVQWLAQNTGKTVIKHPRAMCQLTITSSKKLSKREAISLVYRALALEGFTAIESSNAIYITPEGQDPKLSPELLVAEKKEIPEGRQRLIKFFPLRHLQAVEIKEKVRAVLSDKGSIEADERQNQLIVTDYNENLKLLAEVLREFDVSESDLAIQIYPLRYADAEEVGTLIGAILNGQPAAPSAAPTRSSSAPSSGPVSISGGMPAPGGPIMRDNPGGMPSPATTSTSSSTASTGGLGGLVSAPAVRIWPDRAANRLIVSAAQAKIPEVKRLIELLDTDRQEDVTVRMIPVKNAAAADLARELAPLYQKTAGRSKKEQIEIGSSERANSLFVLSSEANFRTVQKLVNELDTDEAQEKKVQTFILKNADAQDVAKQLQDLGRDQETGRYPYYFFSSSMSGDRKSKKLSVVADRRRNAIVVQAPPNQMETIAKMIEELDEPVGDDSLAPKIYQLKYVSAVDIEDVLNELFLKKQPQRNYYYFFDDYADQQTPDRDVGRLYGKVRITSEPHSNTLIVTSNSKESLAAVENVLNQLDRPSEAGESTLHVKLRFAKASAVANGLNILFAKNGSPPLRQSAVPGQQAQPAQPFQPQNTTGSSQAGFELEKENKEEEYFPWIGGQPDNPRSTDKSSTRPVSDLVGRVRAVADMRSNALLISANVHYFPQVLKLIDELDAQTDQVLIEARIVEVAANYLDRLGVRWSPDGKQVFTPEDLENSAIITTKGNYTTGFGGKTEVNQPGFGDAVRTLTTLRSGVLSSTISMDFLIQFLRKTTDARVLAEPQINIRDNETGRLFVGQQVPIPANNNVSSVGTTTTTFVYKDVGIVLEVTPHINSSGDVELRVHAEASTIVPGAVVLGGSVFDTRNFRTDLTAKNGQTLVLGGIIQQLVSETLYKTPVLGDIPFLGYLFKKKDKTTKDVELMVFLHPRVTMTPKDSEELLEDLYKKVPKLRPGNEGTDPGKEGRVEEGKARS